MQNDEQAIRDLIADWQRATAAGDLPHILTLMDENVIFLVPGQPPMRGRDAFASAFQSVLQNFQLHSINSKCDIQEIEVSENLAYCWSRLKVSIAQLKTGNFMNRSGFTLTVFRKQPSGKWTLYRDANLLTPEPAP